MDQKGMEFAIFDTYLNLEKRLREHECICVGVSGGSDSNIIVHMLAEHFPQYLNKVHFVFQNTGLEYRATLRHLDYMEQRYGIKIDRIRGESVASVVRREGIPIVSKDFSMIVDNASKGHEYGLHRIERTREESKYAMPQKQKDLARYLLANNVKVSYKCCNLSKKKPFHRYLKEIHADLSLSQARDSARVVLEPHGTKAVLKNGKMWTNICPYGGGMTLPKNTIKTRKTFATRTAMKSGA